MKVTGEMTKLMERVYILTWITQDMRVIGLKISNMDTVLNNGQMEHLMKATMLKARSMVKESLLGLMAAPLLENSMTITFMGVEFMNGQMNEYFKENGETTRWRAMEHSHGLMGGGMWVSTMMI